jgi:hypothetical protein
MDASFDSIRALGEIPASHSSRLRFLPEADRSVIASIELGVLFVMAFWSGPARKAFAELKRVLAEVDPQGKLELVVVDTDGCPDLYVTPEFLGNLHGWVEAAWIKAGKIVCTSGKGYHAELFEPLTRELVFNS